MWLLTLAVPVHGFAAASMLGCVNGRLGAVAPVGAHSHAPGMHGDDAVGSLHSQGGEGHAMAHAATHHHAHAEGTGDGAQKLHAAGKVSKASCSACAACSASAALPSTPLTFESAPAPNSFVLPAPQRVASFVSGGLERPPRSVLD